ncbi:MULTISPECIES: hypothetical protein [Tissierellales]|jgi:hypothetical protein|uniref:Glutamate decarboxylase n=1 Tax=Acidilutibacter cellobiosedens TaxID=2507161 RepID=A0A410QAB9_9FIRM|nr:MULTISPECIES: hypothetical protein [Tissierellales]MBE6081441.1 hypothetical protein [Tissierellaceae bacterium]QAT60936.1 hypothetical protein EQM13_04735 [Acidilutibacter cellobiosedens]SCL90929.1 hypothetical protein PP176A_2068 [Sporanaerobacter sp. PP17-6a]
MWTAVYVIEGKGNAAELEKKLKTEGFLIKVKPFAKEGEEMLYEILAPEFEAEEVQTVLIDLGYM